LSSLLSKVRYRFLLLAGIMPYVLGAAAAQYTSGAISVTIFVIGLMGVLGALLGVETYNEFFETRTGSDMVFESEPPPAKPVSTFVLGSFGFAVFVTTGIYLASLAGALILVIAAYGLQAAIFYVGPPIKWAYRGVGESVIALAYGPFMTIGSYYVQTSRLDTQPILLSLVPAFLVFGVVLSNEIPQYHGDSLVGKMNLVVRMGQRRAARVHQLSIILAYASLLVAFFINALPPLALISLATLPAGIWAIRLSAKYFGSPAEFMKSIQGTVVVYTVMLMLISFALVVSR